MKRLTLLLTAVVFVVSAAAQFTLEPEPFLLNERAEKEPVPYPNVRQADIMWSKTVWRRIDLREKINLPLYYPVENYYDINSPFFPLDKRYNVVSLLLYEVMAYYGNTQAIKNTDPNNDKVTVLNKLLEAEQSNEKKGFGPLGKKSDPSYLNYYVYDDDEFKIPKSFTSVWESLGGGYDSVPKYSIYGEEIVDENGKLIYEKVEKSMRIDQVVELQLKEVWYFDKNRSKMEVRILAICPVRLYYDEYFKKDMRVEIGWFYFPAVRKAFANHEVFNRGNDAERRSFDDIFFKRMFNGYIYAETNVYNNRKINEYQQGADALHEAEEIKDDIFKFEHDLWNY
ncbi:MAG: hypothetical protein A2W91_12590 [Bacteroidetes bacterium GWF2_38_335]|nr:MAG: hypothetical protein A2W91_12590 [Bacteroidetes bacterium GWF2_38_335]OFY77004.1 MAG: hypothetical protein A2281_00705 [Bacteroidetes bacterium RIFOXYA12_FULL_38_20]